MGLFNNMEKKVYIAPQMEVVEMELVAMLAASKELGVYDTPTEDDAVMSNGRRGKWGDLWAK